MIMKMNKRKILQRIKKIVELTSRYKVDSKVSYSFKWKGRNN